MPHTMQVVTEPCKLSTFNISEMTKSDAAFTVGLRPFPKGRLAVCWAGQADPAMKPESRALSCIDRWIHHGKALPPC